MSEKKQNKPNLPTHPGTRVAPGILASQSFTGPIPPPDMLAKYEQIQVGLADRIMKQAESQTAHRIKIESIVITSDKNKSYLGIIFAFILGMTGLLGGLFLAYVGKSAEGYVFSGTSLVSLVGTFIYGTTSRRKERASKRDK